MTKYQTPKINVHALRIGYYSDKYFLRTQEILMKDNYDHYVHYQYFPRKNCVVCGINQVLQILESCVGYYKDRKEAWDIFDYMRKIDIYNCPTGELLEFAKYKNLLDELWVSKSSEIEVFSLSEGVSVENMEPVIGIIGNPKYFAHLETPTLGILAQQSAVATSVRKAVDAIGPDRNLLFFPARFRHYVSQAPDGYACSVGGVNMMSTDANGEYWGYNGIGTIPHLLIAAYEGNTAMAAIKFDEIIDPSVNRIILVDWDNDCVGTTLNTIAAYMIRLMEPIFSNRSYRGIQIGKFPTNPDLSRHLIRDYSHVVNQVIGKGKGKIFGVRFDTSGSLIDKSLPKSNENFGVNPRLVFEAREQFNELGLEDLKIIVSGGFDQEKIEYFNKFQAPYDMIGIGSSIVNKFTVDFTADAVTLDGSKNAKVGRHLFDWGRMNAVTFI